MRRCGALGVDISGGGGGGGGGRVGRTRRPGARVQRAGPHLPLDELEVDRVLHDFADLRGDRRLRTSRVRAAPRTLRAASSLRLAHHEPREAAAVDEDRINRALVAERVPHLRERVLHELREAQLERLLVLQHHRVHVLRIRPERPLVPGARPLRRLAAGVPVTVRRLVARVADGRAHQALLAVGVSQARLDVVLVVLALDAAAAVAGGAGAVHVVVVLARLRVVTPIVRRARVRRGLRGGARCRVGPGLASVRGARGGGGGAVRCRICRRDAVPAASLVERHRGARRGADDVRERRTHQERFNCQKGDAAALLLMSMSMWCDRLAQRGTQECHRSKERAGHTASLRETTRSSRRRRAPDSTPSRRAVGIGYYWSESYTRECSGLSLPFEIYTS